MAMQVGGGKSKLPLLMAPSPKERPTMRVPILTQLTPKPFPRLLTPKSTRSAGFQFHHNSGDTRNTRTPIHLQQSPRSVRSVGNPSYFNSPRSTESAGSTFRILRSPRPLQNVRAPIITQHSARELRSSSFRDRVENVQHKKLKLRSVSNLQNNVNVSNDNIMSSNSSSTQKFFENMAMKLKQQEKLQTQQGDEFKSKLECTERKLNSIVNERDALKDRLTEMQYLLDACQKRTTEIDENAKEKMREHNKAEKERLIKVFKAVRAMYETTRGLASVLLSNSECKQEQSFEQEVQWFLSYFTKPIKICIMLFLYVLFSNNKPRY